MSKALFAVILALAIWLVLSPWFLGYPEGVARLADAGFGVAGALLALLGCCRPTIKWPAWLIVLLGLVLVVLAGWGWGTTAASSCLKELVLGILWVLFGIVITQVFHFPSVAAVDKNGVILSEISAIRCKGDDLTIKANLLGTMPTTIYVHPEEIWKTLGMIDSTVIARLPVLLLKGWWRTRRLAKDSSLQSKSAELTSSKRGW